MLRKPNLAELLMPHIFLDLVVYGTEAFGGIHDVLQKNLKRLIKDGTTDTRVVSLLLTCLDHLYSFCLDSQRGPQAAKTAKHGDILAYFHVQRQYWHRVSQHLCLRLSVKQICMVCTWLIMFNSFIVNQSRNIIMQVHEHNLIVTMLLTLLS